MRDAVFAPIVGMSGDEIPFTRLVHLEKDPHECRYRLYPSPWLAGATEAGLPSPLSILGDVTTGAAARSDRPDYERVVTEALRVDILRPHGDDLVMSARQTWSDERRAMAQGTIEDAASGVAVAHVVARIVLLDARRPGSRVVAPPTSRVQHARPPDMRDLLSEPTERARGPEPVFSWLVSTTGALGNSYGFMHGGALAALCDIGLDRLRRIPEEGLVDAIVQSVTLDFFAPVLLTGDAHITAQLVNRGGNRAEVVVGIGNDDAEVGAVACYRLRQVSS
jgi:acyl-coenzyme A thioesterase PaaI-like protein